MSKARARSAMSWPVWPELREVEVDRVEQGYRHRIIDDGIPTAGLAGPRVQRQQRGLGDTAEGDPLFRGLWGAHCSTLAKVRRLRVVVDDL